MTRNSLPVKDRLILCHKMQEIKEDFKYDVMKRLLLAHSIQVYEFNTSKSATRIKEILDSKKESQTSMTYPQIIQVTESRGGS